MRTNRKALAAGIGAAGLLGLGLYVAVPASAADPSPAPSSSARPGAHPGKAHPRGDHPRGDRPRKARPHRQFRGVHGEATVRRKDGFHLATWQRGKVTAVSGTSLTVRSADGASWTWTANGGTRVRKNGEKAGLKALATGDQVVVAGERSGGTRTARLVRVPKHR